MITNPPLFAAGADASSTGNEDSVQRQGGDSMASIWVLDVTGTFVGTIKAEGRVLGAGKAGVSGYTGYLSITDRATGATIAGADGITTPGLYEVNIAGLEARLEWTRSSGNPTVLDKVVHG